jgi:hypothetical protein
MTLIAKKNSGKPILGGTEVPNPLPGMVCYTLARTFVLAASIAASRWKFHPMHQSPFTFASTRKRSIVREISYVALTHTHTIFPPARVIDIGHKMADISANRDSFNMEMNPF